VTEFRKDDEGYPPLPRSWIHPLDAARYHRAARMIEDDAEQAYFTVRRLFGPDVAGVLLVMYMRQKLNKHPDQWPPPEDLIEEVNNFLREKGLMES
jgi:hypothetical protein